VIEREAVKKLQGKFPDCEVTCRDGAIHVDSGQGEPLIVGSDNLVSRINPLSLEAWPPPTPPDAPFQPGEQVWLDHIPGMDMKRDFLDLAREPQSVLYCIPVPGVEPVEWTVGFEFKGLPIEVFPCDVRKTELPNQ